jgi:3-phenylpropionate/trans-cinnamate dioxygenase ferredoxin subunit
VVRVGGTLYAFEDRCTHDGESLAGAELARAAAGPEVLCPRHGARFSLATGAALCPPAYEPLRVFAVREDAGRILVEAEPPPGP